MEWTEKETKLNELRSALRRIDGIEPEYIDDDGLKLLITTVTQHVVTHYGIAFTVPWPRGEKKPQLQLCYSSEREIE